MTGKDVAHSRILICILILTSVMCIFLHFKLGTVFRFTKILYADCNKNFESMKVNTFCYYFVIILMFFQKVMDPPRIFSSIWTENRHKQLLIDDLLKNSFCECFEINSTTFTNEGPHHRRFPENFAKCS